MLNLENEDELEELETLKDRFKKSEVKLWSTHQLQLKTGVKTILIAFQINREIFSNESSKKYRSVMSTSHHSKSNKMAKNFNTQGTSQSKVPQSAYQVASKFFRTTTADKDVIDQEETNGRKKKNEDFFSAMEEKNKSKTKEAYKK